MGTRVPVQHYSLRPASSFIAGSLHDLNTVDARPGEIDGISDVDRDAVTEDSLDNDDESTVDCIHEYRSSIPLHGVGVDEDRSALENSGRSSSPPYNILSVEDVSPIETSRARFLQIVVDHFISEHVIEVGSSTDVDYGHGHDKLSKRKPREVQYEGDPRFKRLTGRHEVAISPRDYKFYTPRHKYRRVGTQSVSNISGLATFSGTESSSPLASATGFRPVNEQPPNQQQPPSKHHMQQLSPQPQFHPLHQAHHQSVQQNQHATHFSHLHQCTHSSHVADIPHQHQSPSMAQHMTCLQCLSGVHVGGRLHLLPTSPAKFCDECGAPYLRETSKFCSECGTKRLGT